MLLSVTKNISLFLILLIPVLAESQAIFSPGNVGMGDNGITHLTNSQAGFINPANLMLFDGPGKWNVNLLQGGHYYNKGFTSVILKSPRNYFTPFDSKSTESGFLTIDDANQIIKKWFGNDQMRSINENLMDVQTIGISYKSQNYAVAFNHRIRGKSSSEIGRGWYDTTFKNIDDNFILDRTLNQKLDIWHEISAAIAWEQDLISGLLGSRSNIYIGINPKILLPVAHIEHQLQSNYTWTESNPLIQNYSHRYVGYVTGDFTNSIKSMITTGNPNQSVGALDYFKINGVGLGLDTGLTWRIIMGEQIRIKSDQRIDSNYHLSLSVAVQDIGFVSYQNESAILTSSVREPTNGSTISPMDREFTGVISDFVHFSTIDYPDFYNTLTLDDSSINRLLPSSITAGIGLKLDQVLIAIEYKQHSNNTQWQSDFSTFHIGNEITLFSVIDIRSGVILHSNEPVTLSAGLGLDTPYFSLSAGTYARQIANTNDFRPVLINVGALSVRF